jgi:nicotinate-nucleotide pyrophosphorylase (carboxylating)
MGFTSEETAACCLLIELALREDFGGEDPTWRGDITSALLIPPSCRGRAMVVARQSGVVAGIPAAILTLGGLGTDLSLQPFVDDGTAVRRGDLLAVLRGHVQHILAIERTMLNFMQRLSGIATLTRAYVDAVKGTSAKILDTRKTTPGWRLLEKYAVRCGGGHNHRVGLYDAILIKDNHLAATGKTRTIAAALNAANRDGRAGFGAKFVEIEVDTLEQFDEALPEGADIILLDNMTPEQMREAVRRRNEGAPQVLLEASGGVTLDTVRAIAETGVDRISVGALTHSAPALDIGLDFEPSP